MCRRRDPTADEFGLGLMRVVHVGTTISGGPPMTEENIAIAVHHLRRISKARERAERAERAMEQNQATGHAPTPRKG